jgi:hypothetical protein
MTTATSSILGVKNFDKKTKRWIGVVCQIVADGDGKESIMVLDCMAADHEIDLDTKLEESIRDKPWIVQ